MEINNNYSRSEFLDKFLAKQDLPKPATNPLLQTMAKEDTFEPSKQKSQPVETAAVKSDDTFIKEEKAEETSKAPENKENEVQKAEEQESLEQTSETNETENTEDIKEVSEKESSEKQTNEEGNVTKKTKFLDKIKGFFKNLFIKLKPKKVEVPTQNNCSAGGTN